MKHIVLLLLLATAIAPWRTIPFLNINFKAKGVYLLKITTEEGTSTARIIKE